jgi:hypothetical protein
VTVDVEVITYTPTVYYHCQHCELTFQEMGFGDRMHREQFKDSLPQDLREEFQDLSDWLHDLLHRHGDRIAIKLVDAASIEGVWKSLRYRLRRYPAVIVNRKEKRIGSDFESVERVIDSYVAAAEAETWSTSEGGWTSGSEAG